VGTGVLESTPVTRQIGDFGLQRPDLTINSRKCRASATICAHRVYASLAVSPLRVSLRDRRKASSGRQIVLVAGATAHADGTDEFAIGEQRQPTGRRRNPGKGQKEGMALGKGFREHLGWTGAAVLALSSAISIEPYWVLSIFKK